MYEPEMSADLDNQPYDNVEFPIRRPPAGGSSGWMGPNMTAAQRENLVTGAAVKERSYTLPTVTEGGGMEEEEEEVGEANVEDQRQALGVINNTFNTVSN